MDTQTQNTTATPAAEPWWIAAGEAVARTARSRDIAATQAAVEDYMREAVRRGENALVSVDCALDDTPLYYDRRTKKVRRW